MPENENVTEETTDETVSDGTASDESTDSAPDTEGDPAALGDAGKKALDSMKSKWREERDKRRDLESRLVALESAPKGDTDQPDADQIKAQATREATEKANARIVRSEIKAAAAGKFADITDVFANIDPAKFEVDDNGEIDPVEISDAIEELLTRKPHLAATARPRFQGTGDGGAARKVSGPSQLAESDLDRMSPEAISKAKREGRLNKLLGITK
jgi:hypothetical protein